MKKKILLMLFFCLIHFVFNIKIKALDEFNIECPKTMTTGLPFSCYITTDKTIMINTDLKVYEGSILMKSSGKITFKATKEGSYDISLTSEDKVNTYKTLTVNILKAPEATTVTTTKKRSSNNFLESITINGEKFQEFTKDNTRYYLKVENNVNNLSINAKAEDDNAKIEINGPKVLEVGDNEYTIGVTAEDNSTKFYKIIVTRNEGEKSSNTDIKSIKIKGYHLNFDNSSKTFYLKISKEDTELDITVNTSDKNANYEIKDNENLKDGSEIKIIVTAENGNKDTYRIIIQKDNKNITPMITSAIIIFMFILILLIIIFTKKKKNNNLKDSNERENINNNKSFNNNNINNYESEKTIEMPSINSSKEVYKEIINNNEHIDNDDDERTRMFSYENNIDLHETNDITGKFNETDEKSLSFDDTNDI